MVNVPESKPVMMRTVRFHAYGEPSDVLRLEETELPVPGPHRIRVRVHACGLNPADWALCRGLLAGNLPRGIGLDVSGTVDAIGAGVEGAGIGDAVLGPADFVDTASAGASDFAILQHWARRPYGLDPTEAAALPMAVETAFRSLENLRVTAEHTVLIHGAGTMMGFAAVQMALLRGARVIATAGKTYADRLRTLGATVTGYGDGMAERVLEAAGKRPDLVLDTAPASGVLPALVRIAGDPSHILTISDFAAAPELGVRTAFGKGESTTLRYDVLEEFAQLAAEGKFTVPIARTFSLEDWRTALHVSQSNGAHGKLMLLPEGAVASA
ncbi:MAG TPA: NADP-dependent oxidoreductase [Bryobacteraceae bacterium]